MEDPVCYLLNLDVGLVLTVRPLNSLGFISRPEVGSLQFWFIFLSGLFVLQVAPKEMMGRILVWCK